MSPPAPRDVRHAVILAVVLTAIAVVALLDPSCRHDDGTARGGSPKSLPTR